MKIRARKVTNSRGNVGLVPIDEAGEDDLRKLADNSRVVLEVKQPRNPYFHRLFFAMLKKVFENQDRFPTEDHLRIALTYEAGYFKEYPMSNGLLVTVPDSIAYEAMDQKEFEEYFNRVADVVMRDYMPDWTSETLVTEIEGLMPQRAA